MSDKQRLQPDFIPVWKSEFADLNTMPQRAFLLRLIYRAYRDPQTSICALSDCEIQRLTGWNREPLRNARRYLLKHGHIKMIGYHTYTLNDFLRHKSTSCTETVQPQKKTCTETVQPIERKTSTSCTETVQQLNGNQPVHNNKIDKDVVDTPDNNNFIELSKDLEALIEELLKAQGIIASPLRRFYYTVVRERRFHKYHEGIIKIAIKRAIAANSKANIQDILSYDALSAIKAEQDRIRQQAADDNKRAAWAKEQRFEGTKKGD